MILNFQAEVTIRGGIVLRASITTKWQLYINSPAVRRPPGGQGWLVCCLTLSPYRGTWRFGRSHRYQLVHVKPLQIGKHLWRLGSHTFLQPEQMPLTLQSYLPHGAKSLAEKDQKKQKTKKNRTLHYYWFTSSGRNNRKDTVIMFLADVLVIYNGPNVVVSLLHWRSYSYNSPAVWMQLST